MTLVPLNSSTPAEAFSVALKAVDRLVALDNSRKVN